MKMKQICTSNTASNLINIPYSEEPSLGQIIPESKGLFIGHSYKMNVPVFLDFMSLFNPHVFIVGMTGSGKTYLMRSMLTRLSLVLEASIIIIDLTGEYSEIASLIGAERKEHSSVEDIDLSRSAYFLLKELKEEEKISASSKILRIIAVKMRKANEKLPKHTFVLLDESWKLMSRNEDLEIIVREGRKYGTGLILASQLLEDMSDSIVSNSASIFLFRLQVKKSAEKAMSNYGLGQEYAEVIQGLGQGSCIFIKLDKNNKRSIIVIRKTAGISLSPKKSIGIGGKMEIEIDTENLQNTACRLCGPEEGKKAMAYISSVPGVRLSDTIREFLERGADRRAVLSELRKLGISDADVADAFSEAITLLSKSEADEETG